MDSENPSRNRIAVLIDVDNIPAKYAEAIFEELAAYGTATVKRAYGDYTQARLAPWTRAFNVHAIKPMQQPAYTTGKNSSDSALIIDAMDLLYADNVEAFAIVSSDSDFTGLAVRLKESGKTVYGLGGRQTPVSLRNACNRFIQLELLASDAASDSAAAEPASTPPSPPSRGRATTKASASVPTDAAPAQPEMEDPPAINLQSALTKAVNATADDTGWARLSDLGSYLTRTHPSFDTRTYGHPKLSPLVQAQRFLTTERRGGHLRVRVK